MFCLKTTSRRQLCVFADHHLIPVTDDGLFNSAACLKRHCSSINGALWWASVRPKAEGAEDQLQRRPKNRRDHWLNAVRRQHNTVVRDHRGRPPRLQNEAWGAISDSEIEINRSKGITMINTACTVVRRGQDDKPASLDEPRANWSYTHSVKSSLAIWLVELYTTVDVNIELSRVSVSNSNT